MYKQNICLAVLISAFTVNCFSQGTLAPAQDKHIAYEGRIAFANGAAELMWPGTSVTIQFEGTGIGGVFKDADTSNYYNVIIDNGNVYKIHTDTAKKIYTLAAGLAYGKHTVEVFKRTEWDKGKTWFYGFVIDEKTKLLKPAALPKRKIEFFGNSISCGYAIEDKTGDSPTGYYENSYDAYAAITARHFNAQLHNTSKSGIGVMVSWFPLIAPEMYNMLDPTDANSKWDFSKYIPDVVVINLFQNDAWIVNMHDNAQFKNRFGTTPPTEEHIIESYKNFVQTIRATYPNAQIICMLGNMDIARKGSSWPGYVQKAVSLINDPKIFTFFMPYKETGGHPKTAEQKVLAQGLIDFIDKNIKW